MTNFHNFFVVGYYDPAMLVYPKIAASTDMPRLNDRLS